MNNQVDELTQKIRQDSDELSESEQHVLESLKERLHVSRDTNQQFERSLTLGERLADRIAAFVGSWVFILIFIVLLMLWMALNTFILTRIGQAFDIYSYIFLNLMLSMVAALQAPLIMMSQNRQAAKDRLGAQHNYEVNLKAELEIHDLHRKIDTLREEQIHLLATLSKQQP